MIEELNKAIAGRIQEVLEYHLNGTQEEFQEAASAVVQEFSAMGNALSDMGMTQGLSMELDNQREELATRLTDALRGTAE